MKKVFATLTALIFFAFSSASCGRPDYPLGPAPTTVPMPVVDLSPVMGEHEEASQPSSPALNENYTDEKFEHLRTAALAAVPDDLTLESAVTRWLISCDNDAITLALPIRLPDMANDISDGTKRRYHVMEVAVCKYYAKDGILYESEVAFVPVLVKVKAESAVVESISVPDIEDNAQCEADIKDIFGVEYEGELALWSGDEETDLGIKDEYSGKLSKLRYDIALAGGYGGYPNIISDILYSMHNAGCDDCSTHEGAVCRYYLEKSFAYTHMEIPMWQELAREEIQEPSNSSLIYSAMYIGTIDTMYDESIMTGSSIFPCMLSLKNESEGYEVGDCTELSTDDVDFEKLFSIFADEYENLCSSEAYEELILDCDSIIESMAEGTFDYNHDSLFPGKTGG